MTHQFIATHTLPVTNTKPFRVVAVSSYGKTRLVVSVDAYDSHDAAHLGAARLLATKLKWAGKWIEGCGPAGNVYVWVPPTMQGMGFTVEPGPVT